MASDSAARRPILALAPRLRGRAAAVLGIILLCFVVLWLVENLAREPKQFALVLGAGLTNGSIYALVALGYTLVYGILELINFAHGDVFSWRRDDHVLDRGQLVRPEWLDPAADVRRAVRRADRLPVFCATLNMTVERVAYRRLRNAPRLAPLITAIGMSFVLSNRSA